jgi:glycosyltransferase involved in cell wall biosynthesis
MGAAAAVFGVRPLVVTWHNAPLGGPARRVTHAALERLSAARAAVVLGASADLVERARRAGAARAELCHVAAPDRPAAPQLSTKGARPVVLAVARLHPQKRLDLLLDATAGWSGSPDAPRVIVVGDGPLREQLAAHAAAVQSPVEFLGERDDVPALLAQATVMVLSSDWEARALAAQEALHAGVPLIATAVGGLPDLVGDAAVLVPAGDADALRQALEQVLSDAALRRRLSVAGAARAATWPTPEAMVSRIRHTYLEVT